MTPEAQRIAIAGSCGWTIHQIEVAGLKDIAILPPGVSIKDEGAVRNYCGIDLPDYLNDLNAMHEALGTLPSDGSWSIYRGWLKIVCNTAGQPESTEWFIEHNATAAKRAEAFLKTLGLWK